MTKSDTESTESPFCFRATRQCGSHCVEYRDLLEACQGGIELGHLHVDGRPVGKKRKFSAPPLISDGYLYVPMDNRGWFSSGFVLCRINLRTHECEKIGRPQGFMWLHKKEGNRIYFFQDMAQTKEGCIEIPARAPSPSE